MLTQLYKSHLIQQHAHAWPLTPPQPGSFRKIRIHHPGCGDSNVYLHLFLRLMKRCNVWPQHDERHWLNFLAQYGKQPPQRQQANEIVFAANFNINELMEALYLLNRFLHTYAARLINLIDPMLADANRTQCGAHQPVYFQYLFPYRPTAGPLIAVAL